MCPKRTTAVNWLYERARNKFVHVKFLFKYFIYIFRVETYLFTDKFKEKENINKIVPNFVCMQWHFCVCKKKKKRMREINKLREFTVAIVSMCGVGVEWYKMCRTVAYIFRNNRKFTHSPTSTDTNRLWVFLQLLIDSRTMLISCSLITLKH